MTTLQKQLLLKKDFDKAEWMTNALHLRHGHPSLAALGPSSLSAVRFFGKIIVRKGTWNTPVSKKKHQHINVFF